MKAIHSKAMAGGNQPCQRFAVWSNDDIEVVSIARYFSKLDHGHTKLSVSFETKCIVFKSMNKLNVDVILGERLDLDSIPFKVDSTKPTIVRTVTGREISADLLVRLFSCLPFLSSLTL